MGSISHQKNNLSPPTRCSQRVDCTLPPAGDGTEAGPPGEARSGQIPQAWGRQPHIVPATGFPCAGAPGRYSLCLV